MTNLTFKWKSVFKDVFDSIPSNFHDEFSEVIEKEAIKYLQKESNNWYHGMILEFKKSKGIN